MTQSKIEDNVVVRVGIIGTGEVAQVVHIPTFGYLSEKFKITYLADTSRESLNFAKERTTIFNKDVKTTLNAIELITSPDVDVVVILTADEYHVEYAIKALQNNKFAFIEKPMALTERDAKSLIEAESKSEKKVFVGYMRRYAPAFELALKEIGDVSKIKFVRVRDYIGPNSTFVDQSGTFPRRFNDYSESDIKDRAERAEELVNQAVRKEIGITDYHGINETRGWRFLGGLGSHDLSLMREVIGLPKGYIGAKISLPFVNALLDYGTFVVSYETGIHSVSEFDAHIEVYTGDKIIKVQYDTPYVKGLPITLNVRQDINGEYVSKTIRPTFEDPYTIQAKKLYRVVAFNEDFKTTARDAIQDLEIFQGILKASNVYSSSNKL